MPKARAKAYPDALQELMGRKTQVLSKAQAFAEMGLSETAQPLWETAAAYEELIAPLMDALGRGLEAAVHRISAASCYRKAGDCSRAANLYQAALAGPLREDTRRDVEAMLAECLSALAAPPAGTPIQVHLRRASAPT